MVSPTPPCGLQLKARSMEMTADQFETLQMYNQMRKVMLCVPVFPPHSSCGNWPTDTIFSVSCIYRVRYTSEQLNCVPHSIRETHLAILPHPY